MSQADRFRITKVDIWPEAIPITDPFVVATGSLTTAQNLFVRITLRGGAQGYGEIAPFADLTGEDCASSFTIAKHLANDMLGKSSARYREVAEMLQSSAPSNPATRCGLETALIDALCHEAAMPLWALWGGADVRARETDITIPITDQKRTVTLAQEWYVRGFRLFKMKVGTDGDEDIRRLEAIHRIMPDVAFIVDANQGFRRQEAAEFTKGVLGFGGQVVLLEQPVPREELEALAWLRRSLGVPVAADESARSLADVKLVAQVEAADFINIKITKSGLVEALEMAAFARGSQLRLMIGGMVETRVAMGCSFSLVLGLGEFEVLDLDTPLLLGQDPVRGGYRYEGPQLHPWWGPGLDMEVTPPPDCVTIE